MVSKRSRKTPTNNPSLTWMELKSVPNATAFTLKFSFLRRGWDALAFKSSEVMLLTSS